jgi:hypothetical protein
MKTSQWIGALAALVAVIFLSTFAINYIGPTKSDGPTTTSGEDVATLEFLHTAYPNLSGGVMVGSLDCEHNKPGHQDYFFRNPNEEPVKFGAVSKSCKCQGVDVYLLPEGYTPRPGITPPNPAVAGAVGGLGRAAAATLTRRGESEEELEAKAVSHTALNPDDPRTEITVPPHRIGWVRMKWTGEKAGAQLLTIKLWIHHPGSGLDVNLERRANFLEPILVAETEQRVGNLRPGDLPKEFSFLVTSATRKSFKITRAQAVRAASLPAESDAFVVGEPVPLSPEECIKATREIKQWLVQSGYRIPVTLRKVAPDGKTPFEVGRFRRRVEVTTDAFDKPVSMTYLGTVQGDFQVTGVDESGGVNFGPFRRGSQQPRRVTVRGGGPGMKLELDKRRIPEYLEAKLTEQPPGPGSLSRSWELEIKILPSAYGSFPRDDDPVYQDSAIYLRPVGQSQQSYRVEVRGDATDI